MLVQLLTIDDTPRGAAILAIDSVGAGVGEKVLVVIEGRAAGEALGRKGAPVDAAIIGIVDAVDVQE
jgi:ethanolamine utilization protein EutN